MAMREKRWVDCPVCGAKKSMERRTNLTERFITHGYQPVDVSGLEGHFCNRCSDGFWSGKSERRISEVLAAARAQEDSRRTVAAEIATVEEAVQKFGVTRQAVHKMMQEGRLRHVYIGDRRFPLRSAVEEKAGTR